MNIVWFKRDLRVEDHQPLAKACARGPFLPLYIVEPGLWQQPDMGYRHYVFLQACLLEFDDTLRALGQPLVIKTGRVCDVLADLKLKYQFKELFSHQETWNAWTYQRDKAVKKWCRDNHVIWHESVQNGVVRCLKDRGGWANSWYKTMSQPVHRPPLRIEKIDEVSEQIPSHENLGLFKDGACDMQKGGRKQALANLNSFLNHRGQRYTKEMSSPLSAVSSCSRLSPYLAFGVVSMREIFHACQQRTDEVKSLSKEKRGQWPSAMRSFSGRLRWHCHFIQKLEDEPRIEFENMHSAYDSLRVSEFNEDYFSAWKIGKTGYPMVDACMRSLIATGWLNFRMRAMLMSFASYHLWLHWREPALHLARLFTDYEPGIHYSQVQMQSGTTGINAIRIYNPIKQGIDQDPDGQFVRKWVDELSHVDKEFIHMPWNLGVKIDGYPSPIVDEKIARNFARERLYGLRKSSTTHYEQAREIVIKHGSRKPRRTNRTGKKNLKDNTQGELPL